MRRVVITGMGAITPIGNDVETFFNNLINGVSGIELIEGIDIKVDVSLAATVKDFDPTIYQDAKEARRSDKFTQYAIAASEQAIQDSQLNLDTLNKERAGVIIGTGIGGTKTLEDNIANYLEKGPKRVSPLMVPMFIPNMAAGNVAIRFGFLGDCICVDTACASSTHSIGEAFRKIAHGYLDVALAGGSESSITPIGITGFCNMTALSKSKDKDRASIPFDKDRNGFVMGEGAGILVLEDLDHALARGAKIYAEIAGFGSTCDAYHITSPHPEGLGASRAMTNAIKEAGLTVDDVDYINAHGTSTPLNDEYETKAIKHAFGEKAYDLSISSTKSMTGHLLGGAGAIEAIATTLAVQNDIVPPTINLEETDEVCDLNYTPKTAVKKTINVALSNSLGFGGHNGTILIKKYV